MIDQLRLSISPLSSLPLKVSFFSVFLTFSFCLIYPLFTISAQEEIKAERMAIMVFTRNGNEQNRVKIERDLRRMVDYATSIKKLNYHVLPVELLYDVGQRKGANLQTARKHFNAAQREFEKGNYEEAEGQLFRARRFYKKGIPYVTDVELLQSIFYYDYITAKALKKTKEARDLYCKYISLSRSIAGISTAMDEIDVLLDLCEESPISGVAELKIKANINGGHVYINNQYVGIVSKKLPYIIPFMSAGLHLVEIRKSGYTRWGKLVELKNGKNVKLKARLRAARNRAKDYTPLHDLKLDYSLEYFADFFFQKQYRLKTDAIILGYLDPDPKDSSKEQLTIFTFKDGQLEEKSIHKIVRNQVDGYKQVLKTYWENTFEFKLDPDQAKPVKARFMPAFFKVE
jgi:hypothetical protein